MNNKYISCCLNCQDRHPGCHAECEQYKAEKAQIEESKADERKSAQIGLYKYESKRKVLIRRQRKVKRTH